MTAVLGEREGVWGSPPWAVGQGSGVLWARREQREGESMSYPDKVINVGLGGKGLSK